MLLTASNCSFPPTGGRACHLSPLLSPLQVVTATYHQVALRKLAMDRKRRMQPNPPTMDLFVIYLKDGRAATMEGVSTRETHETSWLPRNHQAQLPGSLPELCALARHTRRLSLPVDWVYVQVAEAHADDEWPIGNRYNPSVPTRDQTTTLFARAEAVCEMVQGFELVGAGFQICVDNPTSDQDQAMGDFERVLARWPTSWYVLGPESSSATKKAKWVLQYHATPSGQGLFDVNPLASHLEARCHLSPGDFGGETPTPKSLLILQAKIKLRLT
eukprot:g79487.t1